MGKAEDMALIVQQGRQCPDCGASVTYARRLSHSDVWLIDWDPWEDQPKEVPKGTELKATFHVQEAYVMHDPDLGLTELGVDWLKSSQREDWNEKGKLVKVMNPDPALPVWSRHKC